MDKSLDIDKRSDWGNSMQKMKVKTLFFWIALTIELFIVLIDKSVLVNPIEGRLFQITFLLFAVKICMTKYTRREWIIIILFEALGIVSYMATGRNEIIRIVTMIASCKGMNEKAVFSYIFRITLGGCALLGTLSLAGVLGATKVTEVFREGKVETRYCFGMGHPNAFHCMLFMLVLLFLYLYGKNLKKYWYGILFLANVGIFLLTGSRTGMLITAFAVVFAALLVYGTKLQKTAFIYGMTLVILFSCIGIALFAAAFSRRVPYQPVLQQIDKLLSGRIINLYYGCSAQAGTLPTWRLFGVAENGYYFDMGWVRLFYWYGIIPGCIYVAVLALLIWELYKRKEYMGVMVLASLFIYTLVEAHIISVYLARDYTLFLIGMRWCSMFHADKGEEGYFWQIREKNRNI